MRLSSFPSALALTALLGVVILQGPGTRLTYRVRLLERAGAIERELAVGSVSGGFETGFRFGLRTDTNEVEALFEVVPERDTVHLAAEFFTTRRIGTSRRRLPVWEQDTYRRVARLAWTDTARVHLSGHRRPGIGRAVWLELVLDRGFAGGEARPTEQVTRSAGAPEVRLEAVVRPRRARVVLNLVRGAEVTGPVGMDLIPEGAARRLRLMLAGRPVVLEVGLARPEPAAPGRARALGLDADIVCLRVVAPGSAGPVGELCGRLNNVARRLPLPGGDTLVATFVWPGAR